MFLFGFAKSGKADLEPAELAALVTRGARWLGANVAGINRALLDGDLAEVDYEEDEEDQA